MRRISHALLFCFLVSSQAIARITVDIPSDFPTYDYLERLEAYGCVEPSLRSLKPLAYGDVQEGLKPDEPQDQGDPDAEGPSKPQCQAPEWLLEEKHLLTRPTLPSDAKLTLLALHNDIVPLQNIAAVVTPLYPFRENRITFNGPNLYADLLAGGQTGHDWGIALSASPGFVGGLDNYQNVNGRFYFREGYVKFGYQRAELLFGRTALQFGETAHGSLLFSGAAAPIDMIKFSIRPFAIPHVGPFSFQGWYGIAGDTDQFNSSHLAAVALGFRPADWFELSLIEVFQFGGMNQPSLNFTDVLTMLAYGGGSDLDLERQRMAALEMAFWAPDHFAKLYTQFAAEKLTTPSRWFSNDLSTLVGLWFPKVEGGDVRFEYVHTAPAAYESSVFTQGLTYLNSPLGHPIGPDGEGAYLDVGVGAFDGWRPGLGILYEARGKSLTGPLSTEYRYGGGIDVKKRWVYSELSLSGKMAYAVNHLYVKNQNDTITTFMGSWRYSFF